MSLSSHKQLKTSFITMRENSMDMTDFSIFVMLIRKHKNPVFKAFCQWNDKLHPEYYAMKLHMPIPDRQFNNLIDCFVEWDKFWINVYESGLRSI